MNKLTLFLVLLVSMGTAHAGVITLPQLDPTQIDPLAKCLAADLTFRPVEGAAPLTGLGPFGISIGVTAIGTSTSTIQSIIGSSPQYIPGAMANVAVGLPFGFGIEFGMFPNVSYQGSSFNNYGGDLRFNLSHYIPSFPVDLALRGLYSTASLSTAQSLDGVSITADYKTTVTGASLTLGKTFFIFEPYMGLGIIHENSTLSYAGSVSLFNTNFSTGTTSVPTNGTGFWGTLGLQVRILFLQVGAEYATMWGNQTFAAKVALRF